MDTRGKLAHPRSSQSQLPRVEGCPRSGLHIVDGMSTFAENGLRNVLVQLFVVAGVVARVPGQELGRGFVLREASHGVSKVYVFLRIFKLSIKAVRNGCFRGKLRNQRPAEVSETLELLWLLGVLRVASVQLQHPVQQSDRVVQAEDPPLLILDLGLSASPEQRLDDFNDQHD